MSTSQDIRSTAVFQENLKRVTPKVDIYEFCTCFRAAYERIEITVPTPIILVRERYQTETESKSCALLQLTICVEYRNIELIIRFMSELSQVNK
jgi:hypothetical protein